MTSRVYKIGRSELNDIVLDHPSIAEFHAEVFLDPHGNCFYTDLNSPSKTLLNGKLITEPVILKTGDFLELGDRRHFDWEMVFFNRKVQSSYQKPKEEKKVSTPTRETSKLPSEDSFIRKNLDLILIFGGILFLLFIMGLIM